MEAETFLNKYGEAMFRHSSELLAAIQTGACVIEGSGSMNKDCRELLQIYRIRSKGLRELSGLHAASILADVNALICGLEECEGEPYRIWSFSMAPHHSFWVYEALQSNRIVGCIRSIDRLRVSAEFWDRLWIE